MNVPNHLGGHCNVTHVDVGALRFFKGLGCKSFLDVGCGPGGQVVAAEKEGYDDVLGVDGDWSLLGPKHLVVFDLTKSYLALPTHFDLVWCVEVAEHIAPQYEQNLLITLARSCSRFLVITASMDKGPPKHVNCKPKEYWAQKLKELGMTKDDEVYAELLKASTMQREFLRKNGMVFRC